MNMGFPRFEAIAAPDDPKRDIRIGAGIAILFFVVLLGWAALTPLDAAVRAPGVITVLGNRQSVQHPTGGVVTAIHVREGQDVRQGDVLIELSAPETLAAERALTSDYFMLLAQRARLLAEQAGQPSFELPVSSPRDLPTFAGSISTPPTKSIQSFSAASLTVSMPIGPRPNCATFTFCKASPGDFDPQFLSAHARG